MHRSALLTVACLTVTGPLAAQFPELGHTTFPTSADAAAHTQFIKGVLLLHSFEYERARAAFQEAQRLDADYSGGGGLQGAAMPIGTIVSPQCMRSTVESWTTAGK
jgi:hypothetical protein